MRVLVITVAGIASRFSKSLGYSVLKCIYYPKSPKETLLYKMIHSLEEFDKYIIVGGFEFEALKAYVEQELSDLKDKIILVNNPYYREYGSGYSLYLGLKEIVHSDFDEVLFAEGDLFVDKSSLKRVVDSPRSVLTITNSPVMAEKSVAVYCDSEWKLHYIFDTNHGLLRINEPFKAIYNSGQIWKFIDTSHFRKSFESLSENDWQGTNLNFIQKYFGSLDASEYEIIDFKTWINCNTVQDFEKSLDYNSSAIP